MDGSLQYHACVSWPDIAYAAHLLSIHINVKTSMVHLTAAKHVIFYLKYSDKMGITYACCDTSSHTGYTYANYFRLGADFSNIRYVVKIAGGTVT
ncbi:hypothetical protein LPJ71_008670 [Coemansia sp. S17]|nr:hypothetical protein LPJ71_008670 [Coemansia sp. S17]